MITGRKIVRYTRFENRIASLLSAFPRLKRLCKKFYRRINYVIYSGAWGRSEAGHSAEVLHFEKGKAHFFGYYGKNQINRNGLVLLCAADFQNRMPDPKDRLRLLCGKANQKNSFHEIATTQAWNWQQGCMLQWLCNYSGEVVVFNDHRDKKFVSILLDTRTQAETVFDLPVYAVSAGNDFALSLNFSRLYHLNRAYGYCNDTAYELIHRTPADDGVWFLDFKTGNYKLILSLAQLASFRTKPSMARAFHKVNHIEISPDHNRFMVLHRWIVKSRRYSRLITANIDGTDLYVLADDDMVSHCAWRNENQILAWTRKPGTGDRFYLFHDKSEVFNIFGEDLLRQDGHPSFSPDGKYLLTDTYPDKQSLRTLIIYDIEKNKRIVVGRYFSPLQFDGDIRCDLHPRWSIDGNFITFDSCHQHKRNAYIINMAKIDSA